jgi:hypothetical protein
MHKLLVVPVVLMSLCGCASIAFAPAGGNVLGFLYADAGTGSAATENNIGKKKGEACASSILGLITTGDAGIRAAADAGGITQISSIDSNYMNILGLYSKFCTVVSGDSGDGGSTD